MTDLFDISESPLSEPESLTIGNFAQWRRLIDYPSDTFSVFYVIQNGQLGNSKTLVGSYDAANEWWSFSMGAGDYTELVSGDYRWDLYIQRISDGERILFTSGAVVVHETTDDRRTHAEIMIKKIQSVLENRADHDIESYSIKNRSLTRMNVKELLQWRDFYIAEVERTGGSVTNANVPKKNTVRVRFV